MVKLNSSCLSMSQYSKKDQILTLTFKNSNQSYIYQKVTLSTYYKLLRSGSKGKFFRQNILNKYNFQKI